jgi:hypothetical protein
VARVLVFGREARAAPPFFRRTLAKLLVAACPAATIAFLVLLPAAAMLASATTRRPEQRQADYPGKAQTQKLPATHGHSKNRIASGCRFSCIRHRESPCLARFVTILTARRRPRSAEHGSEVPSRLHFLGYVTTLNPSRNVAIPPNPPGGIIVISYTKC